MTETIKSFAHSDIPQYAGGGLAQLAVWALVRLGIPTMFCAITIYYIGIKDSQIIEKDALIQKNSDRVLSAFEQNAISLERLNQSIISLNRNQHGGGR